MESICLRRENRKLEKASEEIYIIEVLIKVEKG